MICPHCAFPNKQGIRNCEKCKQPLKEVTGEAVGDSATVRNPDWLKAPSPLASNTKPPQAKSGEDKEKSEGSQLQETAANSSKPAAAEIQALFSVALEKEKEGKHREAFLSGQSILIDFQGQLEEEVSVNIYKMMGRVSKAQGKAERARKYFVKAQLLRPQDTELAELLKEMSEEAPEAKPVGAPEQSLNSPPHASESIANAIDAALDTENPVEPPSRETVDAKIDIPQAKPEADPGPSAASRAGPDAVREDGLDGVPESTLNSDGDSSGAEAREEAQKETGQEAPLVSGDGRLVWAAGFWIRLCALLIDSVLVTALTVLMMMLSAVALGQQFAVLFEQFFISIDNVLVLVSVMALLMVSYLTIFGRFGGQTVGKMVLGVRVIRVDGHSLSTWQAVRRLLGMLLAGLPGLAGFLWVAFDLNRRGWHDRVAGTLVVWTRPPRSVLATEKTQAVAVGKA